MLIDVYADVVCPWCYVSEKRLEKALALRLDLAVQRRWHPFQLQPGMPEGGLPWSEFAHRKFGGEENMQAAFAHVRAAGAEDGLRFNFDSITSAPNTVDAHRLILFAAKRELQWGTANSLFDAYFARGMDLNNHEELASLAAEIGLDVDEVRATSRAKRA